MKVKRRKELDEITALKAAIIRKGLTQAAIVKESKVGRRTLHNTLNSLTYPSMDTFNKIKSAVGRMR